MELLAGVSLVQMDGVTLDEKSSSFRVLLFQLQLTSYDLQSLCTALGYGALDEYSWR